MYMDKIWIVVHPYFRDACHICCQSYLKSAHIVLVEAWGPCFLMSHLRKDVIQSFPAISDVFQDAIKLHCTLGGKFSNLKNINISIILIVFLCMIHTNSHMNCIYLFILSYMIQTNFEM